MKIRMLVLAAVAVMGLGILPSNAAWLNVVVDLRNPVKPKITTTPMASSQLDGTLVKDHLGRNIYNGLRPHTAPRPPQPGKLLMPMGGVWYYPGHSGTPSTGGGGHGLHPSEIAAAPKTGVTLHFITYNPTTQLPKSFDFYIPTNFNKGDIFILPSSLSLQPVVAVTPVTPATSPPNSQGGQSTSNILMPYGGTGIGSLGLLTDMMVAAYDM